MLSTVHVKNLYIFGMHWTLHYAGKGNGNGNWIKRGSVLG